MNLLCDIRDFKKYNISFLETKKNMVIDGYFTKIIYTDSTISLNGLYLLCPIDVGLGGAAAMVAAAGGGGAQKPRSLMLQISPDEKVIEMLSQIEYEIIEYYKDYLKVNKVNVYSLKNQLKMGMIKVSGIGGSAAGDPVNLGIKHTQGLTIKISGIWETETNLGITFKFYL
jgi:hypothetical protein